MHTYEQDLRAEAQLRSLSEVTINTYLSRVRGLYNYYQREPAELSIADVRKYFLYLMNVKQIGREALRNSYYGVRYYFVHCLGFPPEDLKFMTVTRLSRLPVILTKSEVRQLLSQIKVYDYRMCLELIYACGLRIGEAVKITPADIDGERLLLHVKNGKGNKDRAVPLPVNIYHKLQSYWKTHRNRKVMFPGLRESDRSTTGKPFKRRVLQIAFKKALHEAGIIKKATPHTLRHSYATHLLESGVNIRVIQKFLGHRSLRATIVYIHLTSTTEQKSVELLNDLMSDF